MWVDVYRYLYLYLCLYSYLYFYDKKKSCEIYSNH